MDILKSKWQMREDSQATWPLARCIIETTTQYVSLKANGEPKKNCKPFHYAIGRLLNPDLAEHIVVIHNIHIADNKNEVVKEYAEEKLKLAVKKIVEVLGYNG